MEHIYIVDTALAEVPICDRAIVDSSDLSKEEALTYNQAGLDLVWNFITPGGAMTQTAVTPTDTGGDYDWVNQGNGMYSIKIPASGGASINNDTEGTGWFTGFATGCLPWKSPVFRFLPAAAANALGLGTNFVTTADLETDTTIAAAVSAKLQTDMQADPTDFHVNVMEVNGTAQTANDNGADINAILADTNELQTDWHDGGRLDLLLDTAAAGGGLTADDVVTALMAEPVETTRTFRQFLKNLMAIFMGNSISAQTGTLVNQIYLSEDEVTTQIAATINANGRTITSEAAEV